jgi:hypothetical protein
MPTSTLPTSQVLTPAEQPRAAIGTTTTTTTTNDRSNTRRVLDVRGHKCPMPIVKAKKELASV